MPTTDMPITSVQQLLILHDQRFVIAAYESVLGRKPDEEGQTYFLNRLRAGVHKLVLLRQMRRSREGRAFIPAVVGLDAAIRRHRRANLPIIGPIIRLVTGVEGSGATHRHLRIIGNEIGQLQASQADLLATLSQLVREASFTSRKMAPDHPLIRAAPVSPLSLDPGIMPDDLDSLERRLLGSLRIAARMSGAQA